MGFLGGGSSMPAVQVPDNSAAIRAEEDAKAKAAAEKEAELLRKQRGRASTILTGGLGDTTEATLGTKSLLGG